MSKLMEQNPETQDTTQEPTGEGVTHAVLIAIQTGWSEGGGKKCTPGDGAYSDVETVITRSIHKINHPTS